MLAAEKRLAGAFRPVHRHHARRVGDARRLRTGVATDWFPNGVDARLFLPFHRRPYDADTISFIGRMDYYPNQECMARFCEQVWPLLRQRRPA
jgi:hypothetical protein